MGDRGAFELLGRDGCQTHKQHPQRLARTKDRPQTTLCWTGSEDVLWWVLDCTSLEGSGCVCLWGAHGNAGTWVIFPPLPTPAAAQEAEAAPPLPPVVHLEGPDAELEACPPPAAAAAAALEPAAWAASPDLAEPPTPG
uniref:Uncharacterized protein n=1 Tax=Molossus molossus TaxID=27622 RepID=A0A7J8EEL6_MOLMO|nr:hypothetical protein HJG59_008872 [Molossus molossus]